MQKLYNFNFFTARYFLDKYRI